MMSLPMNQFAFWLTLLGLLLVVRMSDLNAALPPGEHSGAAKEVGQQVEGDWKDARWNRTDVGPFLSSSLRTPAGPIAKAISIRVGDHQEATVAYDLGRPAFRGAWVKGFLKFSASRFGLLDAPTAAGFVAAFWECTESATAPKIAAPITIEFSFTRTSLVSDTNTCRGF